MIRIPFLVTSTMICLMFMFGCGSPAPVETVKRSTDFATLAERVAFLERYVTFRRTYRTLEFQVVHANHSGGVVPGPSEWDIRLVATVPAEELEAWIPAGVVAQSDPREPWLAEVPDAPMAGEFPQWYEEARRSVGVDRKGNRVAYRIWAN